MTARAQVHEMAPVDVLKPGTRPKMLQTRIKKEDRCEDGTCFLKPSPITSSAIELFIRSQKPNSTVFTNLHLVGNQREQL